ncbi:MAG: hypothetical protein ACI8X5_004127 [Planctomycetota bacterium]|jgi:hypothetical protein
MIDAEVLTDGNADASNAALNRIDKMNGPISSFTADAAYDTTAIDEADGVRGAKVIVPPRKTATRSRRPGVRDRTVRRGRASKAGLATASAAAPGSSFRIARFGADGSDARVLRGTDTGTSSKYRA